MMDKSWGGARPGSGRKPVAPDDRRVQIMISVEQETRKKLQEIAKARKMRIGRIIDEMINSEW